MEELQSRPVYWAGIMNNSRDQGEFGVGETESTREHIGRITSSVAEVAYLAVQISVSAEQQSQTGMNEGRGRSISRR